MQNLDNFISVKEFTTLEAIKRALFCMLKYPKDEYPYLKIRYRRYYEYTEISKLVEYFITSEIFCFKNFNEEFKFLKLGNILKLEILVDSSEYFT